MQILQKIKRNVPGSGSLGSFSASCTIRSTALVEASKFFSFFLKFTLSKETKTFSNIKNTRDIHIIPIIHLVHAQLRNKMK